MEQEVREHFHLVNVSQLPEGCKEHVEECVLVNDEVLCVC